MRKHLPNNFARRKKTKTPNFNKHGEALCGKNIPLPNRKEYMKQLIYAVGKFINALHWRVYFHKMKHASEKEKKKHENHPDVQDILNGHNNFGFKSRDMAPEIPEL